MDLGGGLLVGPIGAVARGIRGDNARSIKRVQTLYT